MKKLIYLLILTAGLSGQASAQTSTASLHECVPRLPSTIANFWKIDPKIGYAVHNVGGGVYVISDNGWQSAFLVTDEGVMVFDNDPNRLLPTVTFKSEKTIKLGGKTVELTRNNYHSPEGNLFIYVPQAKFLMAV